MTGVELLKFLYGLTPSDLEKPVVLLIEEEDGSQTQANWGDHAVSRQAIILLSEGFK